MDLDRLKVLTGSRQTRTAHYIDAVRGYYELSREFNLALPMPSWHFTTFAPDQGPGDLFEACEALEGAVADDGGFRPGDHVLDLGCGIGGPAFTIARHSGASVTGINITPWQVIEARARAESAGLSETVRFVEGDFMNMPFDTGTFDAAYTFEALCHSPDYEALFHEVARVLKPGGVFIGTDEVCKDATSDEDYQRFIEPVNAANAIPHMVELGEYGRLLKKAGFVVDVAESLTARGNMTPMGDFIANVIEFFDRPDMTELMTDQAREVLLSYHNSYQAGHIDVVYFRCRKPAEE